MKVKNTNSGKERRQWFARGSWAMEFPRLENIYEWSTYKESKSNNFWIAQ